jgi:hypothetical protein
MQREQVKKSPSLSSLCMQREQVKKSPSLSLRLDISPMIEGVRWPPLRLPGVRWPPPFRFCQKRRNEGVAFETPFPFLSKTNERRGGHRTPPSIQRERVKNDLYLIMSQVLKELVKIEPTQLLQLLSLQA